MINTIANTATEIGFMKLTVHPAQAILLGGNIRLSSLL
jgi:hypothetical protein